ncbi:outer membrane protein assembly factor BamB family protein [Rhodococcus sp. NPDC003382]
MAVTREIRNLLCAAVAAVVTTAGAVAVIAHADGDGTRKITGTVDAAPGLGWTVEARTVHGHESAQFRDPVYGSEYDWGMPGFLDLGDTAVALVGVPGGMALDDAHLVGVDADSGRIRWLSPASDLAGCADSAVDATLVCFTPGWSDDPALVGYDLVTGEITRVPTEWGTFAIAATDDRLYVAEGSVENDDVRVHAGTLLDPDAHFTRAFDMGTGWDDTALPDALDVHHGQGLLTLGTDIAGFDLDTGDETWTAQADGCSRVQPTLGALVVRVHVECDGLRVTGSDLLDGTGAVIAATDSAAAHSPAFDGPADDTVPVLLGDGAYDRATGDPVWSAPELVSVPREPDEYNANTRLGTVRAVLGDVALLTDHTAHTETGLDLRTGTRLWQNVPERSGTVLGHTEDLIVQSDFTGLWAMDVRTGDLEWDIPFLAVDNDPDALGDGGTLSVRPGDRYVYVSARSIIGLRPL